MSALMAWDGVWPWVGLIGMALVVLALLWLPGRFLGFHWQLQRWVRIGERQLEKIDLADSDRSKCVTALKALQVEEVARVLGSVPRGGLDRTLAAIRSLTQALNPAGKRHRSPLRDRFVCEYRRALLVGFGVLAWFFVVPVPGLFVLSAGVYKTSLSLQGILGGLGFVIGVTVLGAGLVRLLQKVERGELGLRGLRQRTNNILPTLNALARRNDRFAAREVSEICGELVEFLIFLDQESYVYARRVLGRIEARLKTKRGSFDNG